MNNIAKENCHKCKSETKQKILFEHKKWGGSQIFAVNESDNVSKEKTAYTICHRAIQVCECLGCENPNIIIVETTGPNYRNSKKSNLLNGLARPVPNWIGSRPSSV